MTFFCILALSQHTGYSQTCSTPAPLGCQTTTPTFTTTQVLSYVSNIPSECTPIVTAGNITGDCNKQRIFTVSCSGGASCQVVFTWIEDDSNPVLNCTSLDLGCNISTSTTDLATMASNLMVSRATDNCGGLYASATPTTNGTGCNSFQEFNIVVTDLCSRSSTCTFRYTWTEDPISTPPTLSCPDPVTIDVASDCIISNATLISAIRNSSDFSVLDNCSAVNDIILDVSPTSLTGGCKTSGDQPMQSVMVTATDGCGNSNTCNVDVLIRDNTPPVFTNCPSNIISIDLTSGCEVSSNTILTAIAATATDNCDNDVAITITSPTSPFMGGCTTTNTQPVTSYTLTATDDCGNTTPCVVNVAINDNILPTITPLPDVFLGCSPSTLPTTASVMATATVSDNCGNPTVVVNDMGITGGCKKVQTFQLVVTDACGNSVTEEVKYNWEVPLVVNGPNNPIVLPQCNPTRPDNNTAINALDIDVGCSVLAYSPSSNRPVSNGCNFSQIFNIDITFGCTLTGSGSGTISHAVEFNWIEDNDAPKLVCPIAPVIIDVGTDCSIDENEILTTIQAEPAFSIESSGCNSTDNVTLNISPNNLLGGCSANSTQPTEIVTIFATDGCDNVGNCQVTIVKRDNTPPSITCPVDITNLSPDSSLPSIDLSSVTATDNCSSSGITINFISDSTSPTSHDFCGNPLTVTRTYRAIDECGNEALCMQSISFNEYPLPSVSLSQPNSVCIDATENITLTGSPLPNSANGDAGSFNPMTGLMDNNNGTATINVSTIGVGTHVISYTYQDGNGCSMTATSNVVVNPIPSIVVSDERNVCIGSTISNITAQMTGGSFSWGVSNAGTTGATNANLTNANTATVTFDATGLQPGTVTLNVIGIDANGCANNGFTQIQVHPNPTANPRDTSLCIGETIRIAGNPTVPTSINSHAWTISNAETTGATNSNLINANTDTVTLNTAGLSADTLHLSYLIRDINGCTSGEIVQVILSPLPTPTITFDTCNADLSTYSVCIIVGTNDTIAVDTGVVTMKGVDSFLVSGIPDDSTINIVVTDTLTGCVTDTSFVHSCNCPTLAAPLLPNDTTICFSDSIPPIVVTTDTNQIVLWFSENAGGMITPVDTTFSYLSLVTDTLYVQGYDTLANCYTQVDTFELIINHTPTIVLQDTICTTDLDTFDLEIGVLDHLNDTIITNYGTVSFISGNDYMISNIPSDSTLTITVRDTLSGCSNTFNYVINCNCLGILNPPVAAADTVRACPGDSISMIATVDSTEVVDWYNSGDTLLVMGDTIYTTNVLGTYYTVTRDTVSGCTSADITAIVFEHHPLPVIDSIYNNQSPYCITDSIYLIGDTIPNVTYAWTTNGTATISDTTLQAPIFSGAGNGEVFTLTVTDTLTGCSAMLTDTVQIDSLPMISSIITTCDADLDSFSIQVFSNATNVTIMSAHGAVAPGTNPYTIIGIPADSTVFLRLDLGTGCMLDTLIAAPSCDCPMVNAPLVQDTFLLCPTDSFPPLIARVDSSETVDWYSTPLDTGMALLVGDTLFTPTALGTYYAVTRDTITGCVSDTTSAIVVATTTAPSFTAIASTNVCQGDSVALIATTQDVGISWEWFTFGTGVVADSSLAMTMAGGVSNGDQFILRGIDANGCIFTDTTNAISVTPPPVLDTILVECTADLNNYNLLVVDSNIVLTASAGLVSNISTDTFQVLLIPTTTNVILTFTDITTNCVDSLVIQAPNCACPQTLTQPVVNNLTICKDETPLLSAVVGPGETVNWFDTIVGGTPLTVNPSFTSPETLPGTYTYYAQTVNSVNGCVSTPRTPVTLTILPLPNPNLTAVTTICPGDSTALTPGLFNSYFWSTGDSTASVTVGAGQYFVTVTDASGCTAVQTATVEELVVQGVNLTLPTMACTADSAFALVGGSPTGGTYSGPGITNGIFDPVAAGVGTHTISYSIGGNCSGAASTQITVMASATADLLLANTAFCSNDGAITLNGGSPAGGTYAGAGVSGTTFDPAIAGIGNHAISYTIGAGTTCESSDTLFVTVTAMATVSFTPTNTTTLCNVAAPVTLSGGSPAGGTYSGTGVSNGVFNPASAGLGTHTITYTLNSGSCTASAVAVYTVTTEPAVSLALGTSRVCNNGGSITLSGGSPAGGTYSGNGVSNGIFNPTGLGAGNYTITYNYADAGGCTGTASATMVVSSSNNVSFNLGNIQLCENSGLYTLSSGSPTGGTFSGPGVVGNTFNPGTAGMGTHTITYTGPASACNGTATSTLSVLSANTQVSLNVNAPNLCSNSGPFTLGGGSPAGGTYSGTGVVNGQFDPAVSGAGTFTVSYSTICGTAVDQVVVQPEMAVSLALTKNSACSTEGSFALNGGSPAGGTFSGPGVSGGNSFNPATVGPGTHTVTYTVNPGSGCTGTATATIVVSNPTTISTSFSLNSPQLCATSGAFTLSGGSPAGGVYSGTGVINGNTFNPALAGAGTHTISYSLNGCSSGSSTATIIVDAAPPIPVLRMSSQVCVGEDLQLEAAAIPGATSYSWTGPNGYTSVFQNPIIPNVTAANAGQYNLVVGVGNCASSMSSMSISVNALPQAVSVSNAGAVCQGSDFELRVDNPVQGDIYNWYYQNGAFIGTGTGLNLSSTNYQAGRYYVTVSRGGCEYNPITDSTAPNFAFTDVVISNQVAVGAFAGDDVTVCEDSYDLNPLLSNNQSIFGFWTAPQGSKAVIADPNQFNSPVFNLEPGNNYFIWSLSNAGCTGLSSDTLIVNYAAPPVLTNDNFTTLFGEATTFDPLSNDQFISGYFLDSVFTTENGTAVVNADGTVSYVPLNTFAGTDQLTYRVCSNICPTVCSTASIGVDVQINTNVAEIVLPNTITPNGDGMNDALIIPEVLQFPGSELVIFNRWGDEVYRSADYRNDWYGFWQENNDLLPVGTYFYVITLNDPNLTRMSGYVYVQRD